MNENPTVEVHKLQPITKFIYTLGVLPTSYLMSMTFQEQLTWLCNYIMQTLIPAMNSNVEAVQELQQLYTDLQDYVNDYFDNLDIQTEVNNKINAMYEAGTLQEIITEYLQINGVLAFDTVADMKASENLIAGSICKTLGKLTYNDGYGYFYRVRQIINTDVIDEDNLIALYDENLVAQKIVNYNATSEIVLDVLDNLDDNITLFVGDSYGALSPTNWVTKYCDMAGLTLNTNAYNLCVGGAGFHNDLDSSNTYLNNLTNGTGSIDKSKVDKIIVCGGWNDRQLSDSQLDTLINTFMTYVKTNFPKAKVYCGMIANTGAIDPYLSTSINYREWLVRYTLPGYKNIEKYGGIYLDGVECIMHKYSLFNTTDLVHPNSNGSNELGVGIYHAVHSGSYNVNSLTYEGVLINKDTVSLHTDLANASSFNLYGYIQNNNFTFRSSGSIAFSVYKAFLATDEYIDIELGTYDATLERFRYMNYCSDIPVLCTATLNQLTYRPTYDGTLTFTKEGKIMLRLYNTYHGTCYITQLSFAKLFTTKPVLMI